eukprot:scaffold4656_cov117-Isochrysis_galbana.AAC.15
MNAAPPRPPTALDARDTPDPPHPHPLLLLSHVLSSAHHTAGILAPLATLPTTLAPHLVHVLGNRPDVDPPLGSDGHNRLLIWRDLDVVDRARVRGARVAERPRVVVPQLDLAVG